jgi:pilus assembly protein Flp/PilA
MNAVIQSTRKLLGLKPREEGATMVEYGLMVALIAVVCLLAVTALGVNIRGVFTQISGAI